MTVISYMDTCSCSVHCPHYSYIPGVRFNTVSISFSFSVMMEGLFETLCFYDEWNPAFESDDDYEREQLEIALYSQIHFDLNTEAVIPDTVHDDTFTIDVRGNHQTGFTASDTTSDVVLNQDISEKYGILPPKEDAIYKLKNEIRTNKVNVARCQSVRINKNKKYDRGTDAIAKNTKTTKVKVVEKGYSKHKSGLAEEMILGESPDSHDSSVADSESIVDSEDGQIYGVLGKQDREHLDLKINIDSSSDDEKDSEYGKLWTWLQWTSIAQISV